MTWKHFDGDFLNKEKNITFENLESWELICWEFTTDIYTNTVLVDCSLGSYLWEGLKSTFFDRDFVLYIVFTKLQKKYRILRSVELFDQTKASSRWNTRAW